LIYFASLDVIEHVTAWNPWWHFL